MNKKTHAVIITAAGSSTRMGGDTKKEFLLINNKTVLEHAVLSFINTNKFNLFLITLPKDYIDKGKDLFKKFANKTKFIFITGGETRQESVYKALKKIKNHSPETVLIHDGARPWIKEQNILEVFNAVIEHGAAVPVCTSINAMKLINEKGFITEHLKRQKTVSAQTPQGFIYEKILSAHEKAKNDNNEYIDDTEIYNKYSGKVFSVQGDPENIKITYKKDIN